MVAERNFKKYRLIFWGTVALIGLIGISIFIVASRNIPDLQDIERPQSDLSTQILSADGKLLRSLYTSQNRLSVRLCDISPHVLDALVATEDIRFFNHNGVDPKSFFAIAVDKLRGKEVRGGSTITMQLSRNLYQRIGRERSLWRKLKEIITAIILERNYTKEEIITSYLNTVSFIGNSYGIQNAAKIYFKKEASDLKIEEAALLIGLLKATNKYNPHRSYEAGIERRNTVLSQMNNYSFISPEQLDSLSKLPINLDRYSLDNHNVGLGPYFTEHIREKFRPILKEKGYNMYTDGLKIYTTLDTRYQKYAEEAQFEHLEWLQKKFSKHIAGKEAWREDTTILDRGMSQSARYQSCKRKNMTQDQIRAEFNIDREMTVFSYEGPIDTVFSPLDSIKYYSQFLETGFVTIDPKTGFVKSWVGGINHQFFQFDHVFKGKRQVGSTFKPFVYTAAFDNGYSPCSEELNQPVFFYDKDGEVEWAPKNATGKTGGFMTLRKGLATSTNIITARLIKKIGANEVCQTAYRMGIQSELDCVPSIALGTTDLSVYELTSAYSTFVNKGVWIEPSVVTHILDKNGNVVWESNPEQREALNEKTAYQMLHMLMGVVDERGGTAGRLRGKYKIKKQIGAKTGTTQNHSDGWFMAVTPNLVGGVWVGCWDRSMRFRNLRMGQGATMALPIFGLFLQKLREDSTVAQGRSTFERPKRFNKTLLCDQDVKKDDSDSLPGPPKKRSVMEFDDDD